MALRPPRSIVARPLTKFDYIQPPVGGLDTDSPPMYCPPSCAPVLDNWCLSENHVSMRSPFTRIGAWPGSLDATNNPNSVGGIIGHLKSNAPQFLMTHSAYRAGGNSVDAFYANWMTRTLAAGLAVSNKVAEYAPMFNGTTGFGTGLATVTDRTTLFGVNGAPGFRELRIGNYIYYISVPDSSVAPLPHPNGVGQIPNNQLLQVAASTQSQFTVAPTVMTGAPRGVIDMAYYQSRLWALGGQSGVSGGAWKDQILRFTNPMLPGGGVAATDWQDPVALSENYIGLPEALDDPTCCIIPYNTALIIFYRYSIYVLRGGTASSYTIQQIAREVGCLDPRSVIPTDHGIYFMSHRGLYLTNGVSVRNVSGRISLELETACAAAVGAVQAGSAPPTITGARLFSGQLIYTISLASPAATGPNQPLVRRTIWSGVYDPGIGGWTRFTSKLWSGNQDSYWKPGSADPSGLGTRGWLPPMLMWVPGNNEVWALGNLYSTIIESIPQGISPYLGINTASALATSQGNPATLNNAITSGVHDGVQNHTTVAGVNVSSLTPTPAYFLSHFIPLSPQGRFQSTAKRVMADYVFQAYSQPQQSQLSMNLTNPVTSADILAADVALSSVATTVHWYVTDVEPAQASFGIQHQSADFNSEIQYAQMRVSYTDSTFGTTVMGQTRAEFYGVGLENQQGPTNR